jgi:hypothetical protein
MTIFYIALAFVIFFIAFLMFGDEQTQGGIPIPIIVGFIVLFLIALAQMNS